LVEWLIALAAVLLSATVGASVMYQKRIRRAQIEYEKAKMAVDDIVMSFNRELLRESEKVEVLAYRVEGILGRTESGSKRMDSAEKRIGALEDQESAISKRGDSVPSAISEITEKIRKVETVQEALKVQIASLDEQVGKLPTFPEPNSEAVIPIRRDKALAALTDTELAVLELLVSEGSKTAPEIKERVKLSREHTARLMKKLYEGGYLERETGKIPFKYRIKKEMESLLRKSETNAI
jgi:chromosome segregation ATPase